MSLSQNFILGSLQHIPYQRSLSYYHFLLFFLSIFHKKYPGFSRTSPNSFVESFIAEIVAEYYGTAEPPVRCGESHLSGLTEPPHFVY